MKHILNFALVAVMATCAAMAQEHDPRTSSETSALVERIVTERLAKHDQRLSSLESRTGYLERLFHGLPVDGTESVADKTSTGKTSEVGPKPAAQANTHVIAKGETLSSIARLHGVSVVELAQMNGISIYDTIYIGDPLKVPGEAPAFKESQARNEPIPVTHQQTTGNGSFHRVAPGDTLSRIAALHKKQIGYLMKLNGLSDPDQIKIGELIYLTGEVRETEPKSTGGGRPAGPVAKTPSPAEEETYHYYDVANGDTLSTIAETFFTTVQELRKLNALPENAAIRVGQQLIVPTKAYFDYLREEGVIG